MKIVLGGAEQRIEKRGGDAPEQAGQANWQPGEKEMQACEEGLLMGNDRAWEAECVGRAWAGHTEDIGIWEGLVSGLSLAGFQQKRWEQGVG